jgi:hypothetical protein
VQLSSPIDLFIRSIKPEVRRQPEHRLPSIPAYWSSKTTHLLRPTTLHKATTLDLQLVPASTTNRANTLDSKIVALQTTGVGSTGVPVDRRICDDDAAHSFTHLHQEQTEVRCHQQHNMPDRLQDLQRPSLLLLATTAGSAAEHRLPSRSTAGSAAIKLQHQPTDRRVCDSSILATTAGSAADAPHY